jgi:hypothetical protein
MSCEVVNGELTLLCCGKDKGWKNINELTSWNAGTRKIALQEQKTGRVEWIQYFIYVIHFAFDGQKAIPPSVIERNRHKY